MVARGVRNMDVNLNEIRQLDSALALDEHFRAHVRKQIEEGDGR